MATRLEGNITMDTTCLQASVHMLHRRLGVGELSMLFSTLSPTQVHVMSYAAGVDSKTAHSGCGFSMPW